MTTRSARLERLVQPDPVRHQVEAGTSVRAHARQPPGQPTGGPAALQAGHVDAVLLQVDLHQPFQPALQQLHLGRRRPLLGGEHSAASTNPIRTSHATVSRTPRSRCTGYRARSAPRPPSVVADPPTPTTMSFAPCVQGRRDRARPCRRSTRRPRRCPPRRPPGPGPRPAPSRSRPACPTGATPPPPGHPAVRSPWWSGWPRRAPPACPRPRRPAAPPPRCGPTPATAPRQRLPRPPPRWRCRGTCRGRRRLARSASVGRRAPGTDRRVRGDVAESNRPVVIAPTADR